MMEVATYTDGAQIDAGRIHLTFDQTRHREGSRGSVINEYDLKINGVIVAVVRESIEYSLEEVPIQILTPFSPTNTHCFGAPNAY